MPADLFKSCPFCGVYGVQSVEVYPSREMQSVVECHGCGAVGPPADDDLTAIAAWNQRSEGYEPI